MKRTPLFALAAGLTLAACRTTPAPTQPTDTSSVTPTVVLHGMVYRAPIYPVDRPGVLNAAPLPGASIAVSTPNTSSVLKLVTDSAGHFTLQTAPGTYTLTPLPFPNQPLPRPGAAVTITLGTGAVLYDTLTYDTGIR